MATSLQVEKQHYEQLLKDFKSTAQGYRLGQHLYNELNFHKLTDQELPNKLYQMDGNRAKNFFLSFVELV